MIRRVYVRPIAATCAIGGAADDRVELIVREGAAVTARSIAAATRDALAPCVPDDLVADALQQLCALQADPAQVPECGEIAPGAAAVMGILNVTPDSFSDGGRDLRATLAHAEAMWTAGAALIDVGGESTRPGASPVAIEAELARVLPVVARLARAGMRVSVDTRNAAAMAAALDAGAAMINDVSALRHDPASLGIVAAAGVPVVLMHAPGSGDDLHARADYADVVLDVFDFLRDARDAAIEGGIARDRIVLDPGIGFGKSVADNLALIAALPLLRALGCPVLVGASRKRMIARIAARAPATAQDAGDRLGGSIALALAAIDGGARLLRVHDVAETLQAASVWAALNPGRRTRPCSC